MYDLRSSSVCRYPTEGERPLSLPLLLFSALVILFMSSSLQTLILVPAFIFSNYRAVLSLSESETFLEELLALYERFLQSDLSLLVQLFGGAFTLALTLVFVLALLRRKAGSLALFKRGALKKYLLGLVFGGALFAACFGLAMVNGSFKLVGTASPVPIGMLILLFFGYVVQAASEEVLFRGLVMCELVRRGAPAKAVLFSAGLFALVHFSNPELGIVALLNLFLFGVLAALLVLRSGSLIGACALHTAWNFTEGHIFGCSVSGLFTESSVFHFEALSSHSLTNGGGFGPEGGIAVTVVFLLTILLLLIFPSRSTRSALD